MSSTPHILLFVVELYWLCGRSSNTFTFTHSKKIKHSPSSTQAILYTEEIWQLSNLTNHSFKHFINLLNFSDSILPKNKLIWWTKTRLPNHKILNIRYLITDIPTRVTTPTLNLLCSPSISSLTLWISWVWYSLMAPRMWARTNRALNREKMRNISFAFLAVPSWSLRRAAILVSTRSILSS